VTWGKFLPASEGGRFAEVLLDATVGWPLLARAMIDRGL
jgi:deoxyhypusine synthase